MRKFVCLDCGRRRPARAMQNLWGDVGECRSLPACWDAQRKGKKRYDRRISGWHGYWGNSRKYGSK